MKIVVHATNHVSGESHRAFQEEVEVEINDKVEAVKVKVSLVYTSLNL